MSCKAHSQCGPGQYFHGASTTQSGACSSCLAATGDECNRQYTFLLKDSYGDGWEGSSASLLVNGNAVLSRKTVNSYSASYQFPAADGACIKVVFHADGSSIGETSFSVSDATGSTLLQESKGQSGGVVKETKTTCPSPVCPCTCTDNTHTRDTPYYQNATMHRVAACLVQPKCQKGQRLSGTSIVKKEVCTACPPNTYRDQSSHRYRDCTPHTRCSAGRYTNGATPSAPGTCTGCPAHSYQDENSVLTACKAHTKCNTSTYTKAASATVAGVCTDCAANTYQDENGVRTACKPHTTCGQGKFHTGSSRAKPGACQACGVHTYQENANVLTTACKPHTNCSEPTAILSKSSCTRSYTLFMKDSDGDGWNGNAVSIVVNGKAVVSRAYVSSGSTHTVNFDAENGADVKAEFHADGRYISETSFSISDPNGNTILSSATGQSRSFTKEAKTTVCSDPDVCPDPTACPCACTAKSIVAMPRFLKNADATKNGVCTAFSRCSSGKYYAAPGDQWKDTNCTTCPALTYQTKNNHLLPLCVATSCGVGQYVSSDSSSQSGCTPHTRCSAGRYNKGASLSAPGTCTGCPTHSYQNETSVLTGCKAHSTCGPGQFLSGATTNRDGTCLPCPLFSTVVTAISKSSCTRSYTLFMKDSDGDGWNGNAVSIVVNGKAVVSRAYVSSGSTHTVNFDAENGADVKAEFHADGRYISETSFSISDPNGNTILSSATGQSRSFTKEAKTTVCSDPGGCPDPKACPCACTAKSIVTTPIVFPYQSATNHRFAMCPTQPMCKAGERLSGKSTTKLEACLDCQSDTYQDQARHQYVTCKNQERCAVTHYLSGADLTRAGTCTLKRVSCPEGQFFTAGSSSKTSDDATCTTCGNGKFKTGTSVATACSTKRTTCPTGQYFTAGSNSQTTLHAVLNAPEGQFFTAGSSKTSDDTTCTAQPKCKNGVLTSDEGALLKNTRGTCVCDYGYTGSLCGECSTQTHERVFNTTTGVDECVDNGKVKTCSKGLYSNGASPPQCVQCEPGKYSDTTGKKDVGACTPCPGGANQVSNVGSTSDADCYFKYAAAPSLAAQGYCSGDGSENGRASEGRGLSRIPTEADCKAFAEENGHAFMQSSVPSANLKLCQDAKEGNCNEIGASRCGTVFATVNVDTLCPAMCNTCTLAKEAGCVRVGTSDAGNDTYSFGPASFEVYFFGAESPVAFVKTFAPVCAAFFCVRSF